MLNTIGRLPRDRLSGYCMSKKTVAGVRLTRRYIWVKESHVMSSYSKLLYHIIRATKYRACVLTESRRVELLKYLTGAFKNQGCRLNAINAVEDHLHVLVGIPHTKQIPKLIGEIKRSASVWIKSTAIFPRFQGWQRGYALFTVGYPERERVIRYIAMQEEHHRRKDFVEEYLELPVSHDIEFDEQYPWI